LKHGVKFQSGDEFIADDVVFGFERLMAKTRPFARHGKHVAKITAVDRYRVRIDFKEADVDFFDGTSLFPASRAYYGRVGEKEFARHPNGIGPYELITYRPGEYFDLKAFPG
jgi:peptide/nickel transport system substrate-binding protein